MKSILLYVNEDDGFDARLQVSCDLARAFDGHITCLQAVSYEVFAPGDIYGSAMAAAMPVIKEAAQEFRAKTEADLANEDIAWEWQFLYGLPEHRLLEQSAINDLVVVGAHDVGESGRRASHFVGDLVTRSRTPVLVVPEEHNRLDPKGPAMVAWNGSSEACIALRAALPMLAKSSAVHLVSVSEEKQRERFDIPPTSGAEYLSRHGIDCEIVEIPRDKEPVDQTLFSAAESRRCEYMVMGAYGHSRLAEMLLGGVTRRVLTDPKLPILMAH